MQNYNLSKKTKSYFLRVILASVLSLIIGIAGVGQTLQAAAEGLAQTGTGSPLAGDMRIAPDLKSVSVQQSATAPSNDNIADATVIALDGK